MMSHLRAFVIATMILLIGSAAGADRALPKEAVLVVGQLSVSGSYIDNTESPSTGPGDTVQWWIQGSQMWRIKTFHRDHDLHVNVVPLQHPDPVKFAEDHIRKHYGSVLRSVTVLRMRNVNDAASIQHSLTTTGLGATVLVSTYGFGFWNPDGGAYKARSTPER